MRVPSPWAALLIVGGGATMLATEPHMPPVVTALAPRASLQAGVAAAPTSPPAAVPLGDEGTAYVCPMHSDYTADKAGTCPRCGMDLVLATPFDMRDYRLDFQTVPRLVAAGGPVKMLFKIFHPGSGEATRKFELVHDKPYHLFVISEDMEFFQHIHPEQRADGSWQVDTTLPKAGYYKVLSDFLPSGGASQFIARPLITAGYSGDLIADSAHLVDDTNLTKRVNDITATVSYEPRRFVAGEYGHITYQLLDSKTGQPVRDLQTYLGAFGHTLIMSEDMVDYVHSHPVDQLPPHTDLESLRGGPNVTFEGLMPKPGHYRAWTQFRRNDVVSTFAYTFTVVDVGDAR